ncbi:hypothetical protein B0H63DRAFT_456271 [Podospora didyma]|uniref:Uncharacterized protein n=1 Tax=Podospora didyma TaxID=330526 RepID=A0AAE0N0R0_9PEZI|nr:hypothetical protein B0H63DRAFT_456271 [Podospora didyma]
MNPPVTSSMLSELDIDRLCRDPFLRHELNFHPNLHMTAIKYARGGTTNRFWEVLLGQLYLFCLPRLLRTIRDIMQTFVSPDNNHLVDEALDVDFMIEQFDKGVASIDRLAIKFNLANFQLEHIRPLLIEDTVDFERRLFTITDTLTVHDINKAGVWYRDAKASPANKLCAFSPASRQTQKCFGIPATFFLDKNRIEALRSEIYDIIYVDICMRIYRDYAEGSKTADAARSSRKRDRSSGPDPNTRLPSAATLHGSLCSLVETAQPAASPDQRWLALITPAEVEIARHLGSTPGLEDQLARSMEIHSAAFRNAESDFHRRMLTALANQLHPAHLTNSDFDSVALNVIPTRKV